MGGCKEANEHDLQNLSLVAAVGKVSNELRKLASLVGKEWRCVHSFLIATTL